MLTLENLKAFRDDLKIVSVELDELIKVRSESKIFNSSQEYYLALKACEFYPQDYFKIRLFDYEFCLRFSNKKKQFYIKPDSVKFIDNTFYDISQFIDKYNIELIDQMTLKFTGNYNSNYFIPEQKDFDSVIRIFCEFIIAFIKYYFSQDKLFAYEL